MMRGAPYQGKRALSCDDRAAENAANCGPGGGEGLRPLAGARAALELGRKARTGKANVLGDACEQIDEARGKLAGKELFDGVGAVACQGLSSDCLRFGRGNRNSIEAPDFLRKKRQANDQAKNQGKE